MDKDYKEYRISKLRKYLLNVIDEITGNKNSKINADMLDNKADNYSLDKIPSAGTVERWITGVEIHRDVFSFKSRRNYSQDTINNLMNIGFFEIFEEVIEDNNRNKVLPEIEGIQKIECLNCGSMLHENGTTAEFDIQIAITYII